MGVVQLLRDKGAVISGEEFSRIERTAAVFWSDPVVQFYRNEMLGFDFSHHFQECQRSLVG